jgi:hypothetical protein
VVATPPAAPDQPTASPSPSPTTPPEIERQCADASIAQGLAGQQPSEPLALGAAHSGDPS